MMPEALLKQWVSIPGHIQIDEEFGLLWSVTMAARTHLKEEHPDWITQLDRGVAELQAILPSAIRGDEKEVARFIFEMLVGICPDTCSVGRLLKYQASRLCTALLLVPSVEEPESIPNNQGRKNKLVSNETGCTSKSDFGVLEADQKLRIAGIRQTKSGRNRTK